MPKEQTAYCPGTVVEICRDAYFRVRLDGSDRMILARFNGRLWKHHIALTVGDRVTVEVTPYSLDRARIMRRL